MFDLVWLLFFPAMLTGEYVEHKMVTALGGSLYFPCPTPADLKGVSLIEYRLSTNEKTLSECRTYNILRDKNYNSKCLGGNWSHTEYNWKILNSDTGPGKAFVTKPSSQLGDEREYRCSTKYLSRFDNHTCRDKGGFWANSTCVLRQDLNNIHISLVLNESIHFQSTYNRPELECLMLKGRACSLSCLFNNVSPVNQVKLSKSGRDIKELEVFERRNGSITLVCCQAKKCKTTQVFFPSGRVGYFLNAKNITFKYIQKLTVTILSKKVEGVCARSDGNLFREVSLYATEKSYTETLIFCTFCAWLVILLEIFATLYLSTSQ